MSLVFKCRFRFDENDVDLVLSARLVLYEDRRGPPQIRLNEKSDTINETISRVENALRESSAGLEFRFPKALTLDSSSAGRSIYLGYVRATVQDWYLKVRGVPGCPDRRRNGLRPRG